MHAVRAVHAVPSVLCVHWLIICVCTSICAVRAVCIHCLIICACVRAVCAVCAVCVHAKYAMRELVDCSCMH